MTAITLFETVLIFLIVRAKFQFMVIVKLLLLHCTHIYRHIHEYIHKYGCKQAPRQMHRHTNKYECIYVSTCTSDVVHIYMLTYPH